MITANEIEISYSIKIGAGAKNFIIVKIDGEEVHKEPIVDGGSGVKYLLWAANLLKLLGFEPDKDIMDAFDSNINGRCITFRRVLSSK